MKQVPKGKRQSGNRMENQIMQQKTMDAGVSDKKKRPDMNAQQNAKHSMQPGSEALPGGATITLLHQEKDYVVCVKPVGMDAEHELPAALRAQLGGEFYTLHRLDANVGGVMVYARTGKAAAEFSRMIQCGDMVKEYVALVHGVPEECGDWEDLLWKDSKKNKVFVVNRERKGVKPACLEYRRLATKTYGDVLQTTGVTEQSEISPSGKKSAENEEDMISLVRIRLHTGRSHQIRVQFASRKYPLLGDHKYGARDKMTAPMLFSCCITFPYHGEKHRYEMLPEWAEV